MIDVLFNWWIIYWILPIKNDILPIECDRLNIERYRSIFKSSDGKCGKPCPIYIVLPMCSLPTIYSILPILNRILQWKLLTFTDECAIGKFQHSIGKLN